MFWLQDAFQKRRLNIHEASAAAVNVKRHHEEIVTSAEWELFVYVTSQNSSGDLVLCCDPMKELLLFV